MKIRALSFVYFLSFLSTINAAIPTGYYDNANGKNTATLRNALETIISNGFISKSYDYLYTIYKTSDVNPSTGYIWDMYSNCTYDINSTSERCGNYSLECDCYNREHSVPQSWFGSASPMVSDAFHIYPTDGKVNGMRSNYPFGEVSSASYTSGNGSKLGTSGFSGYSGTVFEPINEFKGDFARTYFYMATRYASVCGSWGNSVFTSTASNLGLTTYAINLFLKWSREDPVSQKEISRNDAVYEYQNNRNPFIDYPGLEEYIWGNKTSQAFSTTTSSNPDQATITVGRIVGAGTTLSFGKVTSTTTKTLQIKTEDITGDLTVSVSGTMFSVSTVTITKSSAESGYSLNIIYNPTSTGTHSGVVTISGGGLSPNYSVNLSGSK